MLNKNLVINGSLLLALMISSIAWCQMKTMPALSSEELNQINQQPIAPEITVTPSTTPADPPPPNPEMYETKVLEQNIDGNNPSNPLSNEAPNLTGQGNVLTVPF